MKSNKEYITHAYSVLGDQGNGKVLQNFAAALYINSQRVEKMASDILSDSENKTLENFMERHEHVLFFPAEVQGWLTENENPENFLVLPSLVIGDCGYIAWANTFGDMPQASEAWITATAVYISLKDEAALERYDQEAALPSG